MSLLAFLTGLSSGAANSITAERDQARQEQEAELEYRRKNMEHMADAAMKGLVDPSMVGRVFEEYMNSMQGLSSRPLAKGKAGFMGKRDISENSILRDLGTGAVNLFTKPGSQLNIDWGAADPKTQFSGMNLPTGLPGMPFVPATQTTPGTPLEQLISKARAEVSAGTEGTGLYRHPITVQQEAEADALQKLLSSEQIRTRMNLLETARNYGHGGPLANRYGNRPVPTKYMGVETRFDPVTQQYFKVGLNKETDKVEVISEVEDISGLVPPTAIQYFVNDAGAISPMIKGSTTPLGTSGPGIGRTTAPRYPYNPPQPTGEKLSDAAAKDLYDNIWQAITNDPILKWRMPGTPERTAGEAAMYLSMAPDNVKDEFRTWDKFKARVFTRVGNANASPIPGVTNVSGSTEPMESDEEVWARFLRSKGLIDSPTLRSQYKTQKTSDGSTTLWDQIMTKRKKRGT
jgi:hypothetical protein